MERLLQARLFDARPLDVTPRGFLHLPYVRRPESAAPADAELGRFVREARTVYQVTSPASAATYLQEQVFNPIEAFDQEELWALLLNTKNKITHEAMIYRGTVNSSYVRVAELFKAAIRVNSTALILAHNHPSGDPTPSPEDVRVTSAAVEASTILELELLDHIIVGHDKWVSLKERGLGFG